MIEELLKSKQISTKEFKLYQLFTSSLGAEVFKEMKEELFWEEPPEDMMTAAVLGFYDGRRSVLRGIKVIIDKVETIITNQQLESSVNE